MDYRIVKQEKQTFLALVRAFPCSIINDDSDHSIPDFWDECAANGLVERLRLLRPEGRRDLYGLCSPKRDAEYAVFRCMGEDGDCISDTWARFYKEFLPGSCYDQTELTDYEIYFEQGEKGLFCELWIPVARK